MNAWEMTQEAALELELWNWASLLLLSDRDGYDWEQEQEKQYSVSYEHSIVSYCVIWGPSVLGILEWVIFKILFVM